MPLAEAVRIKLNYPVSSHLKNPELTGWNG